MVQQTDGHAIKFSAADHVFKPAERRLTGKIKAAVRQTVKVHLQGRIIAQGIAVIAIFVTAGDLVDTLRRKLSDRMHNRRRPTGIGDAVGQSRDNTGSEFGFAQKQDVGIAGNATTMEIKGHFLPWTGAREATGKGSNKDCWVCCPVFIFVERECMDIACILLA